MTRLAPLDAVGSSLRIQAEALRVLAEQADRGVIVEAARAIAAAPRIITCGSGSTGFAAGKFAHSLCCIEKPAKFMPPAEAVHGGLGAVQSGDVAVIISRGGRTAELQPIIEVVGKKGATLIALTENRESTLAQAADIVIPLVITQESDPLQTMATTSNLVIAALLDAVLAAVMAMTDYTLDQFALIHPGGAVGQRLNQEA
jgi:D-arabinose 5-phosphate isomerase GutQ